MENDEFNEWDFYPMSLTNKEVNDPLRVLADFFYDDWLPGHLARLQKWRDHVINDNYFRGNKNSPAELLYFHKLNINLVEALHLFKEKTKVENTIRVIFDLESEINTWRDFPHNLKEAELLNPLIVVDQFFQDYHLPQYREMLYEWLEYGLSSEAANEFIATKDLITVYENLQRLYSAAWLIYQRLTDNPYLKDKPIKNDMETVYSNPPETEVSLYSLSTALFPEVHETLKKIIGIIKHKVPSVQSIIYLGAMPKQSDRIFLLVLTSDTEQNQASALRSTIEESCQNISSVTALVHYASALNNAVCENNLFFSRALHCPVIYLSGDLLLPAVKPLFNLPQKNDASFNWERWRTQGQEFLAGAEFYLQNNAVKPALFSLHQCSECLLIAIVRGVLGYRINNHNLTKLLHITQMFTGELIGVFDLHVPEKKELFNLLQHAYVSVRYRDTFEPDIEQVAALYRVIKYFVSVTEQVYERHLLTATLLDCKL